jgi:hypothetical protein
MHGSAGERASHVYCSAVESLAVLVVLIVFGIIGLGVVSFVVVLRPARRGWTRALFLPLAVLAVLGGGWLALLDLVVIGGGTLLVIGGGVALAGLVALVRSLRARRSPA